jgi:hypothetical protein
MTLIVVHALYPNYGIDSTSAALFILLIAPWLFPFIRRISIPGGGGIEPRDVERIEKASEKVSEAQVQVSARRRPRATQTQRLTMNLLLDEDPNLALAGLRMYTEQSVRRVLRTVKDVPDSNRFMSLGNMVDYLHQREILSSELQEAILSINKVCNRAVHQTDVTRATASRVIEAAGPVLVALEQVSGSRRSQIAT